MSESNIRLTDIHTHILPGVDDGSENMQESAEMLGMAYETGTRRIVLTPHYMAGGNEYGPQDLDRLYEELKENIRDAYPGMELFLGNEVMYTPEAAEDLHAGNIHTMNGTRYVLVEYLPDIPYGMLVQSISTLQGRGWWPVIAHVERYICLADKKDRYGELTDRGVCLQMNTNSLTGSRFSRRTRLCRKLVREGLISFLGTDAHGAAYRTPECRQALSWLADALDRRELEDILWNNADLMLHGEILR